MSRRMKSAVLLAAVGVLASPFSAAADTVDGGGGGWGALTLTGASQAYTGTLALGGGFPAATISSDSKSAAGVQSGASTYLNSATPVGAKYGSSQGKQYLNLRPKENNANAPSTTTYTFDSPTPAGGWTFVLGDIDADRVAISATDATGAAVPASGLGFRSAFNYCGGSPSPCPANPDVPVWDGAGGLIGNAGAQDTDGAAAWFEPTVPLKTLTFTYHWRNGLPLYQTWFASLAHDISGTVTGCPSAGGTAAAGVSVELVGPAGQRLAKTVTGADGTYSFTGFTAAPGYKVEATAPSGCVLVGASKPADLSTGDVTGLEFVSTHETERPEPCGAGSGGSSGSAGSSGSVGGSTGSSDTCAAGPGSASGFGSLDLGSSVGSTSGMG
ncbi:carboxypeptidase-like regulatory domain-containing protein [Rhodococcus sp. NPDC127528]|uniref:carboxypeptidase-like regulatory domain-containing protein n=1 Tax=unclassified Rhodococcus (in: high G+C Gram-positive bacteria) TaxID=192944 RepID=UPI00362DC9F8